jgi:hypothetical protein
MLPAFSSAANARRLSPVRHRPSPDQRRGQARCRLQEYLDEDGSHLLIDFVGRGRNEADPVVACSSKRF